MALEIDQRTWIEYNIKIVRFWARFWDRFGVHFRSFGLKKCAAELEPLMFGILLARFSVPRRLGGPTQSHFGTILVSFCTDFSKKIGTETRPYKLSTQQPNNTTTQQTNNLTIQQSHRSKNQHALLATRRLDAGWWGPAKRKQFEG